MEYLDAEESLVRAEALALARDDFDTLSRLYMPLQEARRQRRQRCGEGTVKLDFIAKSASQLMDVEQIVTQYPHGQLLIAGFGSIEPALRLRDLQRQRKLYVETFLAASYPVGSGVAVMLVGTGDVKLAEPSPRSIDELLRLAPPHSIVLSETELPPGQQRGDWRTFAHTMGMWERLHLPHLAAADMQHDPRQKIAHYRKTIEVDYACELAHQKLSDVARTLIIP